MDAEIARRKGSAGAAATDGAASLAGMYGLMKNGAVAKVEEVVKVSRL